MKYSNVAGFVCHIVNVIVILYSVIFFPESTANFYSGVTYIFWLLVNVNGLLFSASAGIVVNHMVRVHLLYCCTVSLDIIAADLLLCGLYEDR